jgi:uncharacterized membrane protein
MQLFSILDLIALACFIGAWIGYALAAEHTSRGKTGLNAKMNTYRAIWMRRMLDRDVRIIDAQIMAALQNGTAFFASTSLLAIGGALTLLRSTEEILSVVSDMPFGLQTTRAAWEAKTLGLVIIFAYAFFKFAWSYRLFNYVAIMLGGMPHRSEKAETESQTYLQRTTRLFEAAGRHFNRGQRAFFFALGYLGWFIGPLVLIGTTAAVVVVIWRRQFVSDARQALIDE